MRLREIPIDERSILDAMLQDYLGELAVFTPIERDDSGYLYPYLDFYWQEPDRCPYFIEAADRVVGFILVRQEPDPDRAGMIHEIAEMYVQPAARRQKLGANAVQAIWQRNPGRWRIGVMKENKAAESFWRSLISHEDSNYTFEQDNKDEMGFFFLDASLP